jgi:hypothetical protein
MTRESNKQFSESYVNRLICSKLFLAQREEQRLQLFANQRRGEDLNARTGQQVDGGNDTLWSLTVHNPHKI